MVPIELIGRVESLAFVVKALGPLFRGFIEEVIIVLEIPVGLLMVLRFEGSASSTVGSKSRKVAP